MSKILDKLSGFSQHEGPTFSDGRRDFTNVVAEIIKYCQLDAPEDSPEVLIEKVYAQLGIKLVEVDFTQLGEADDVLGYTIAKAETMLSEGEQHSVVAAVRQTDPYVRKRFTAAHELYHAIFDMYEKLKADGLAASFVRRSGKPADPDQRRNEGDADEFAAQMLMPTERLKRVYEDMILKSICALASKFGVSPVNMKERLDNLNLTDYLNDVLMGFNETHHTPACHCLVEQA